MAMTGEYCGMCQARMFYDSRPYCPECDEDHRQSQSYEEETASLRELLVICGLAAELGETAKWR